MYCDILYNVAMFGERHRSEFVKYRCQCRDLDSSNEFSTSMRIRRFSHRAVLMPVVEHQVCLVVAIGLIDIVNRQRHRTRVGFDSHGAP
jgi:hypothetical protein